MRSQLGRLLLFWGMIALTGISWSTAQSQPECTGAGTTERSDYYADAIQTRMYYTVYLPPCYAETDQSYPVLYLMHGSNNDDNHWLRLGLAEKLDAAITAGDLPPFIVVLPFGNWIANENRFDWASWGAVFIDQLMPLVEGQYRIQAEPQFRAIGGISRGGFWAFHLAFRHPELFSAVGGHSAFFDRYHAPETDNPLDLATSVPEIANLRIALDRGADDYAAPGLDIMHERLDSAGVPHTYTIYPQGQHNNDYWVQHVEEYLQFYAADWQMPDVDTTETTAEPSIFVTATPHAESTAAVAIQGVDLLLPVVAFPSLETNISSQKLLDLRVGVYDPKLVLSESVNFWLADKGIVAPTGTRIVAADGLFNTLWRDRTLYTLLPFDQLNPRYRILHVDGVHPLDMDLARYDFAFPSAEPNYDPDKLTRLTMSGVTALTRRTRDALDANGVDWSVEAIQPYINQADFFHTSNEVSIYSTCPETTGPLYGGAYMSFCSKPEHFEVLNLIDADIVELSGNHNNDYGYDAYRETLQWYADNGMVTIGGGETLADARRPYLFTHNGNRVALLACNWFGPYYALVNEDPALTGGVRPGAAFCETSWLRQALPQLAVENDLVIVSVQYVEHDQYVPTTQQQIDFRSLVNWGADVVMGTQAHFPQTYEFVPRGSETDAFIHYGLGNLFFDQEFFAGKRFFMDQLFIYDGELLTVDVFTGMIEGRGQPRPMTEEEQRNFLFLMFNRYGGM